jgi:hypothetical protein
MRTCLVAAVLLVGAHAWEPIDPLTISPTDPGYEAGFQARVDALLNRENWTVPGGTLGAECADAYTDLDQG